MFILKMTGLVSEPRAGIVRQCRDSSFDSAAGPARDPAAWTALGESADSDEFVLASGSYLAGTLSPGAGARGRWRRQQAGTMKHHRDHSVVHLELHTRDLAEVRAFLWQLLGWRSQEVGTGASNYLTLPVSDRMGGGIVECGLQPAS
jgi:hypothetical protein